MKWCKLVNAANVVLDMSYLYEISMVVRHVEKLNALMIEKNLEAIR